MIKLIESLLGSGDGVGSRRLQVGAVALGLITTMPELAWPVVAISGLTILGLSVTDVVELVGKTAPSEDKEAS